MVRNFCREDSEMLIFEEWTFKTLMCGRDERRMPTATKPNTKMIIRKAVTLMHIHAQHVKQRQERCPLELGSWMSSYIVRLPGISEKATRFVRCCWCWCCGNGGFGFWRCCCWLDDAPANPAIAQRISELIDNLDGQTNELIWAFILLIPTLEIYFRWPEQLRTTSYSW